MTFQEIVAWTKRHLTEEYSENSFIWADRETYSYFKTLTAPPPEPVVAAPAPQPVFKPQPVRTPPKPAAAPVEKPVTQPAPPPKRQIEETKERNAQDFSAVRAALPEHISIVETIPDDAIAKRIAQSWKENLPEVILIGDEATTEQQDLLKKISDAIVTLGYTSALLTNNIPWEILLTSPHIKMVLITQNSLHQHADISDKYRFDPSRKRHYLDGLLLCPLPPLDKLQTDPSIKANLWQTIRTLLK